MDDDSRHLFTNGRTPRAWLFDVDGTLVDTNELHAAAWREAFLHFGHEVSVEAIGWQVGKGGDNLIPSLLPDVGGEEQAALEAWRGDLYKRCYMPRAVPFEGVRALFERIVADGARVVLASSSSEAEVAYYLGLIGAEDLVAASTSKDDAGSSKPCPDIFEAALAKLRMPPGDAIVVGDSVWDVKAAAKAGLGAIGFRSGGFPDDALLEAGARALFDGPADLLARYDTLFARDEEKESV
jgi:phosphoglycolate phosphatase-like HAD superfamily hydrolase